MAASRKDSFGGEPKLADMLDDPVVQEMMNRDGVEKDKLIELLDRMNERLAADEKSG